MTEPSAISGDPPLGGLKPFHLNSIGGDGVLSLRNNGVDIVTCPKSKVQPKWNAISWLLIHLRPLIIQQIKNVSEWTFDV